MNANEANSEQLSLAVVLYLGFGVDSLPGENRARLAEMFGATRSAELEGVVTSLVEEINATKVDWSSHSLESAGDIAVAEVHARHPELSDSALEALKWKFTFDWR